MISQLKSENRIILKNCLLTFFINNQHLGIFYTPLFTFIWMFTNTSFHRARQLIAQINWMPKKDDLHWIIYLQPFHISNQSSLFDGNTFDPAHIQSYESRLQFAVCKLFLRQFLHYLNGFKHVSTLHPRHFNMEWNNNKNKSTTVDMCMRTTKKKAAD